MISIISSFIAGIQKYIILCLLVIIALLVIQSHWYKVKKETCDNVLTSCIYDKHIEVSNAINKCKKENTDETIYNGGVLDANSTYTFGLYKNL